MLSHLLGLSFWGSGALWLHPLFFQSTRCYSCSPYLWTLPFMGSSLHKCLFSLLVLLLHRFHSSKDLVMLTMRSHQITSSLTLCMLMILLVHLSQSYNNELLHVTTSNVPTINMNFPPKMFALQQQLANVIAPLHLSQLWSFSLPTTLVWISPLLTSGISFVLQTPISLDSSQTSTQTFCHITLSDELQGWWYLLQGLSRARTLIHMWSLTYIVLSSHDTSPSAFFVHLEQLVMIFSFLTHIHILVNLYLH